MRTLESALNCTHLGFEVIPMSFEREACTLVCRYREPTATPPASRGTSVTIGGIPTILSFTTGLAIRCPTRVTTSDACRLCPTYCPKNND